MTALEMVEIIRQAQHFLREEPISDNKVLNDIRQHTADKLHLVTAELARRDGRFDGPER